MVIVPSGIWLTGRIVLLSDVNLHLSEGPNCIFRVLWPIISPLFYPSMAWRSILWALWYMPTDRKYRSYR